MAKIGRAEIEESLFKTLKIVLCGAETIKEMAEKYGTINTTTRTVIHDNLKRLIEAEYVLPAVSRSDLEELKRRNYVALPNKEDGREMLYQPDYNGLACATWIFQGNFGLGLKEVMEERDPEQFKTWWRHTHALMKENHADRVWAITQPLLEQYKKLPKSEWKKAFEKYKNSVLVSSIENYWKHFKELKPAEQRLFIKVSDNENNFLARFYYWLADTPPGRIVQIRNHIQQKEIRDLVAWLNATGLKYYQETKGDVPTKIKKLKNSLDYAYFLQQDEVAKKEFLKEVKPIQKEAIKKYHSEIKRLKKKRGD